MGGLQMKSAILLAFLIALAGCTQTEGQKQVAIAQEILYCNDLGARTQEQIFQCRMMLHEGAAQAQAQRQAAAMRASAALLAQPQPRMINCTTTTQGVFTNTNCY